MTEPDAATKLIDHAVRAHLIPGAVLAAGIRTSHPIILHVAGYAQDDAGGRRPMVAGTLFDLASLTKVVATTPCVLHLVAIDEIRLDDPVTRFLPEFSGPGKNLVTMRHLLAHTSGLPDQRRYYEYLQDAAAVRAAALAEPLTATPGAAFCYSDVGFILLGEIVAVAAGAGIDTLVQQVVCAPLGMSATGYLPRGARKVGAAATELVGGAAKTGMVHDENAEVLGGVAGHAGLFGTAADLARYAAAWVGEQIGRSGPGWLADEVRAEALRCQTEGLGGRRGLGWSLRGDPWDNMGDGWPESGAGHTGFTGTSLSIDPRTGLWAVLLTNAVHYGRGPGHSVVGLRKQVHAAVAEALLG